MERLFSKSTKWLRLIGYTIVLNTSSLALASEESVVDDYKTLSSEYVGHYMNNNLEAAFQVSLKQLDMDPSDSIAFLRLALSVRGSCNLVKPHFSNYGSMNELKDVTILARKLIQKECQIYL